MDLSMTSDYVPASGCPEPYLRSIAAAGFTHVHWCGDDDESGCVNDRDPPRFLAEWKKRFREVSIHTGATAYAVNAYGPDGEGKCGSCGGAFVFRNGSEITGKDVPEGCWRQPVDSPVYVI